MSEILREMSDIFLTEDIDWMDYRIDAINNYLTFHHIKEARNGGLLIIPNGALITKKAHLLLNYYEVYDYLTYVRLNGLFKELNTTMAPPDEAYWHELNKIYSKIRARKLPQRSGRHN